MLKVDNADSEDSCESLKIQLLENGEYSLLKFSRKKVDTNRYIGGYKKKGTQTNLGTKRALKPEEEFFV